MSKKAQQAQREAKRLERLQRLLSSVPHIKRSAQVFDERAYREATEAAMAALSGSSIHAPNEAVVK